MSLFPTPAVLAAGALLTAGAAHGAGIAITEMSARGLGTAFASGGAAAEDASAQWFNPASGVLLGESLAVTVSRIAPTFDYADQGSLQQTGAVQRPLLPGAPRTADGGDASTVPALFYTRPLSGDLTLGIGVNAPFGLTTEYDHDWRGRYEALTSEIVSYNVNPSLAYRVSPRWSLGVGVSFNYLDAELTNAVDFAAVCAAAAGGRCPNGAGPGQGDFDGFVRNEADGTAVGFNFGVLWHAERTRIGLSYRSELHHDLGGDVAYRTPSSLGGFAALGPRLRGALGARFANSDTRVPLTLPDSLHLNAYHRLGRVALVADLTWFDWADISEVRIVPDNAAAEPLVEPLSWQSSLRGAVGVVVDGGGRWTWRAGIAYDESPIPDRRARTPRLPDNDRIWLAAGASYRLSAVWSVDAGYAHLYLDDTDIRRPGTTGGLLVGQYDSSADIVSVELSARL